MTRGWNLGWLRMLRNETHACLRIRYWTEKNRWFAPLIALKLNAALILIDLFWTIGVVKSCLWFYGVSFLVEKHVHSNDVFKGTGYKIQNWRIFIGIIKLQTKIIPGARIEYLWTLPCAIFSITHPHTPDGCQRNPETEIPL